jgi:hypothetical protein
MEPKEDNPETLGQLAFNAYNESKGGTTWDGRPIPKWADLGSEVQTAWEASATAIFNYWNELLLEEEE